MCLGPLIPILYLYMYNCIRASVIYFSFRCTGEIFFFFFPRLVITFLKRYAFNTVHFTVDVWLAGRSMTTSAVLAREGEVKVLNNFRKKKSKKTALFIQHIGNTTLWVTFAINARSLLTCNQRHRVFIKYFVFPKILK